MVLESQTTRKAQRQFYGPAHRGSRWPWGVVIVGLALVVMGLAGWWWSRGQSLTPQATADTATDDVDGKATIAVHPSPGLDAVRHLPFDAAVGPPVAQATPGTPSTPGTLGNPDTPGTSPRADLDRHTAAGATAATMPAALSIGPSAQTQPTSGFSQGMNLIADAKLVEGRQVLSQVLADPETSEGDAQTIRDTLASVNKSLIFSPKVYPGDPLTEAYVVQQGDRLQRLANQYHVTYPFLETINKVTANRIRWGLKLKMVRGPFHAVVSKSAFRMDLYLDTPAPGTAPGAASGDAPGGVRIYIRSFPVGLGTADSTPLGHWIIRPGGKVRNPDWTNPRTNDHYAADDPKNPIGKFWLGLRGADDQTKELSAYGIHGTIEPDSIGKQSSMGCIRLRDEDIALVYQMLIEGESTVNVVP